MLGILSPYHLTSREPAAAAAFFLARRVVTLLPGPAGLDAPASAATRDQVREGAQRSPAYLRFMESWKWSMPLWNSGVLASQLDGDDPAADALAARARIRDERGLQPLRAFMALDSERADPGAARPTAGGARARPSSASDIDRLSTDILKGGIDPTIGAPIAAGLDAFAARHAATVFRPDPVSVAQRSEAALAERCFAIAAPVLLQAGAERVLAARDALRSCLEALWGALDAAARDFASGSTDSRSPGREPGGGVAHGVGVRADDSRRATEAALADYTREYLRLRPELLREDPDGPRVTDAYVSLTLTCLPVSAALRCAAAAVGELARRATHFGPGPDSTPAPGRSAARSDGSGRGWGGSGEGAPARAPQGEARVACLFVRVTGARPEASASVSAMPRAGATAPAHPAPPR